MSALTRFLGNLAGQVAARAIIPRIVSATGAVGRMEPGRYPHPEYGPIIIPRGAESDPEQPGQVNHVLQGPPFQIATWAVFAAYGGLLWYAARTTTATALADLPDQPLGQSFSEAEEEALFPGLKRELQPFEVEDVATSADPVEACLQRRGWKLDRVAKLMESIQKKQALDLFEAQDEELTGGEAELLDDINDCLKRLEKTFGSLEAAGVSCGACSDLPEVKIGDHVEFLTTGGSQKTGTVSNIIDDQVYVVPDGAKSSIPVQSVLRVIPTKHVGEKPFVKTEPHHFTREEFMARSLPRGDFTKEDMGTAHRFLVQMAIEAGKFLPPEVMAEHEAQEEGKWE